MPTYILAADQGTTSSRALLFDADQNVVGMSQREIMQTYPHDGWVEEDPMEIYSSQLGVINEVVAKSGVRAADIAALGITNQRETVIVWDRETGRPVCNAIVWQCRRTAGLCEELKAQGLTEYVRQTTGLVIDAYFSATKIKWILDHVPDARERARRGELLCGTVDSWLIYKLTSGRVHATDYTNASRTMLYDIRNLCWDRRLCEELDIPLVMLPEVRPSNGDFGSFNLGGVELPIRGVAGDQQAALFGQTCFEKGEVKNTYGTGCFLLANTGDTPYYSRHGLITTLAASSEKRVQYALEGSVFVAGAAVQWLRDELGLIHDAADTEYFAAKVPDTAGVYMVPAFTGLGAPYWDMYARGTIVGLTRGAGRNHIIRAAMESIAFQSNAVLRAMEGDMGCRLRELRVDGGASANDFLMKFQSDISDLSILRPRIRETTALGAAYLAGLGAGVWQSLDDIRRGNGIDAVFSPTMSEAKRASLCRGYERAVQRAQGWAKEDADIL